MYKKGIIMELKLNRIQKISKIAEIICKVLFILSVVGTCIITVSIILFLIFGNFSVKIGSIDIHNIIDGYDQITKPQLCLIALRGLVESVVSAILFGFAKNYLSSEIIDGTPFTEKGSKEIFRLGVLTIALPLAALFVISVINELLKIESGFEAEIPVTAGIILIIASLIFSYGADLEKNKQKEESDNNSNN